MMVRATVGIIGGSGLYKMEGLTDVERVKVSTPFGKPSDELVLGTLEGVRVAFLPRHGVGHRIMPSEINFRANIYALKSLGVNAVIGVTATGSLKEEIRPLDFVVIDQLFDRTYRRIGTFFGNGIVAHTSMAEPFCPVLRGFLVEACKRIDVRVHDGGTYVCIEGPQFSTRAESNAFRQLGFDVIGMTNMQEARLAREAQMCYATIACVTDYDVWRDATEDVTIQEVIANLNKNVGNAMAVIRDVVPRIDDARRCGCREALKSAIITGREHISDEIRERLGFLINEYL
ncbi:MAG TPA: S-methyl-5'-thioadenosine phosphorylase [bacterium]|nr:S-methyl-5'-thioadenosine phosphorylase [bacterium]